MPMFGITPTIAGITAAATGNKTLSDIAKFSSFAGPAAMAAGGATAAIAGGAAKEGPAGAFRGASQVGTGAAGAMSGNPLAAGAAGTSALGATMGGFTAPESPFQAPEGVRGPGLESGPYEGQDPIDFGSGGIFGAGPFRRV